MDVYDHFKNENIWKYLWNLHSSIQEVCVCWGGGPSQWTGRRHSESIPPHPDPRFWWVGWGPIPSQAAGKGHRLWNPTFCSGFRTCSYRNVCSCSQWVNHLTHGDHWVLTWEMGKPQDRWGDKIRKCMPSVWWWGVLHVCCCCYCYHDCYHESGFHLGPGLCCLQGAGHRHLCVSSRLGRLPSPHQGPAQQPLPTACGDSEGMA